MTSTLATIPLPTPRCPITVRPAEARDVPFIDSLQKMHSHMVGWMPAKQLESYIAGGHVVVAEEGAEQVPSSEFGVPSPTRNFQLGTRNSLGYCIAKDQYMKRDDVGIIYQLNVAPLQQRNLIGASLIKATFERAAYGCRLFSCWCAQDIQANYFWESIGFIPLAFRTGSRAKQRIHIFWQRRIRAAEETSAYWFPSQTGGGAVGEDRIVLPIPPGTHWRDAKPLVLPGLPAPPQESPKEMLPGGQPVRPRPEQPKLSAAQRAAIQRCHSRHLAGVPLGKRAVITASGFKYVDRTDYVPELDAPEGFEPKPKRPRTPRQKNDPKYVAAARELRDRFLEQINTPGERMLPSAQGKYDVSRQLEAASSSLQQIPLLKAA